jgi:hypothetical protein
MFVKLFGAILDSSIWAEDNDTRILWITMLVMADANGVVRASGSGIAHRARISEAAFRKALKTLEAPDLDSKNQDFGGRRVEKVEGGWLVLNYKKYREIRTQEQMRAAERQQRHRAKEDVTGHVTDRDKSNVTTEAEAATSSEVDASAEADAGFAHAKGPEGQPVRSPLLDALAGAMPDDRGAQAYLERTGTDG